MFAKVATKTDSVLQSCYPTIWRSISKLNRDVLCECAHGRIIWSPGWQLQRGVGRMKGATSSRYNTAWNGWRDNTGLGCWETVRRSHMADGIFIRAHQIHKVLRVRQTRRRWVSLQLEPPHRWCSCSNSEPFEPSLLHLE